jgi:tetratricopeptide (TPR) repeat protein
MQRVHCELKRKFAAVTALVFAGLLIGCGAKARSPASLAALRVAATQPSYKQKLAGAKDLFYQAVAGDKEALPQAQQILDELGGGDSPDPEVVAYTGAVELLQANHSSIVWEKLRLARDGLDLQDKAVKEAPDNLEVRFLRGVTDYQLPDYLGRHDVGVEDLTAVAKVAERASGSGRLDKRAAAAAMVYYGKAMEQKYKIPEAIAAWQTAVRISPDSPGGIDAVKHLAEHGIPPNQQSAGL